MKKCFIMWLVVCLLPVSSVLAQTGDTTHVVELPDGTALTLPAEWDFQDSAGVYHFSRGEEAALDIYLPAIIGDYYSAFETEVSSEQVLTFMLQDVLDVPVDPAQVRHVLDLVEYPFDTETGSGFAAVMPWGPGLLFYVVTAPPDGLDDVLSVARDILSQLPTPESDAPEPESGVPAAVPAADCTVTANAAYGVPLRLGPGLNRGEYTSLMPGAGPVHVIGQAEASDGSQWWRVENSDPNVQELWVAASDVTTSGGCEQVGAVDAPPIIPPAPGMVQQVPTQPAAQQPGESGPAPETPADTSLVPRTGTWYMSASSELLMSCQGGDTIRVPSQMDYLQGRVYLSTRNGGATIVLSDAAGTLVLTQAGPGYYSVQEPDPLPNTYGMFYLHVTGPTSMWGELVVGFTDVPCSGTLPISITFQG